MELVRQVKRKLAGPTLLVLWTACLPAAGAPDAQEILRAVRIGQSAQHRVIAGRLRAGSRAMPFRLVLAGDVIRYEFADTGETVVVHLGEKDARLERTTAGATGGGAVGRLDEKVQGSDLTYEDLSLHFLYWKAARVVGEDRVMARSCWILELHPGAGDVSQYGTVRAWIDKTSGALLKAECFGRDGRLAMRFTLKSIQRASDTEGVWIPRSLRIERMEGERPRDKTPTYLEMEPA